MNDTFSQICCCGGHVNRSKIQEVPASQRLLTLFEKIAGPNFNESLPGFGTCSPESELSRGMVHFISQAVTLLIPVDPN
jgi:hypothetical protein